MSVFWELFLGNCKKYFFWYIAPCKKKHMSGSLFLTVLVKSKLLLQMKHCRYDFPEETEADTKGLNTAVKKL